MSDQSAIRHCAPRKGYRYALPHLRERRKQLGLTVKELAQLIPMPKATLERVEGQTLRLSPERQRRLVQLLEAEESALFATDDPFDELLAREAALYEQGKSAAEIGVLVGRTKKAVLGDLERLGIERRHGLSPTTVDRLVHLYIVEAKGGPTVARELGIPESTVYYHLGRLGIERRSGAPRPKYPLPEPRECETCGKIFTPKHPCDAIGRRGRFCSPGCARGNGAARERARVAAREQHSAADERLAELRERGVLDTQWIADDGGGGGGGSPAARPHATRAPRTRPSRARHERVTP